VSIGVVIADDQALLRSSFRLLIEAEPDMAVLGEAADGAEAVSLARQVRPDVVLMDVRMPGLDGIEATRRIASESSTAAVMVLILTTFDLDEYVYGALQAGASGFVLKEISPEDLLTAIRVVAAGEALLAPRVTRRLIAEFAQRRHVPTPTASSELDALTEREKEVLGHVARGLSNAEIAEVLHMSPGTAKTHVSRLLAKLGARDRAQLVVLAYESRMALPGQRRTPMAANSKRSRP
jgi:DNA-binding NarL/FixJ family response regulator